jgi:hypothetical protein
MKARGIQCVTLIYPTAVVASSAVIAKGVIFCPFVLVSDHAVLADFVMMNFYSSCGHDTKLGTYGMFSRYATANGFVTMEDELFLVSKRDDQRVPESWCRRENQRQFSSVGRRSGREICIWCSRKGQELSFSQTPIRRDGIAFRD